MRHHFVKLFFRVNFLKLIHFFFKLFLDYLLSNNHINNIIIHKFDFTDEEIMAYYISFLKTLSLKLNNHSIHFFFNEVINLNLFFFNNLNKKIYFKRTNEFPLYVEAIKFFDHPEAMVRIAVRTITLNIYRGKYVKYICNM